MAKWRKLSRRIIFADTALVRYSLLNQCWYSMNFQDLSYLLHQIFWRHIFWNITEKVNSNVFQNVLSCDAIRVGCKGRDSKGEPTKIRHFPIITIQINFRNFQGICFLSIICFHILFEKMLWKWGLYTKVRTLLVKYLLPTLYPDHCFIFYLLIDVLIWHQH